MTTNAPGDSARLFPWQMSHYLVHGGPNDPVTATPTVAGSPIPPTGLGYLSWNSSIALGPVAGTVPPPGVPVPRVQALVSGGSLTTGLMSGNAPVAGPPVQGGGIYIGTIPQGSWIKEVELQCYAALAGTATSIGIFYCPSGLISSANTPGYQPPQLPLLASILTPAASTVYSTAGGAANRVAFSSLAIAPGPLGAGVPNGAEFQGFVSGGTTLNVTNLVSGTIAAGQQLVGNGVVANTLISSGGGNTWTLGTTQTATINGTLATMPPTNSPAVLASVYDIDLYVIAFLIAGGATTLTAGCFSVMVEFTGLEG